MEQILNANLQELTLFGLSVVAVVYWLVAHARRNGVITSNRASFLAPGALWALLVGLYAYAPRFGALVLAVLAGWVATLLFKAGAKDNERKPAPEHEPGEHQR